MTPLRLSALPMPPFAGDWRDGGNTSTWLKPVGITPFHGDVEQAGVMPLAGGVLGFTHFDVIIYLNEQMTIVRLTPAQVMDEAAVGGSDAFARAEAAIERITRRRDAFAGLTMQSPQIMGIINTTPDSFSDGGDHDSADMAVEIGQQMASDGAAILDVGGCSTRPGALPVGLDEEAVRILPVIDGLAKAGHLVSADTQHAEVMDLALNAGARIINDVGGLCGDGAVEIVAKRAASAIIMHMQGVPETMQTAPSYTYPPTDVFDWLERRIEAACRAGIGLEHLAIDPGFGFGKTPEQNMMLMANIAIFHGLGVPIVFGISRKSTIAHYSRGEDPKNREAGSTALAALALQQGVQVFRVHDVAMTAQAIGNAKAFAQY